MTEFRNSYHFVNRKPPRPEDCRALPEQQADYGLGPDICDGHAAYAPGTHSGRIRCRVTLVCPTVIGGKRHSGETLNRYSWVEPFLFNGKPAIPATSLKGLISAIAESASRAPYRVLADEKLTVAWSERNPTGGFIRYRHYEGNSTKKGGTLTRVQDHVEPQSRPLALHSAGKARRVTRSEVNPVEAMFGFIRENASKGPPGTLPKATPAKGTPVAAAGKLRFSHALPGGGWQTRACDEFFVKGDIQPDGRYIPSGVKLVRLKEQSQPMKEYVKDGQSMRSATPNFYFIHKTHPDTFIAKSDFAANPRNYTLQGAKFYLHHPDATTATPWKTADDRKSHRDLERKAAAAVLRAGIVFDFHIDFDNLSDHELCILCYALRPSGRYRHKIGLGRALGLGSIRIDIVDLVTIVRATRYSPAGVFADDPRQPRGAAPGAQADTGMAWRDAHDCWLRQNDSGARTALLAIGETHNFDVDAAHPRDDTPVPWVPLIESKYQGRATANAERDSFKWFVENDQTWRQPLPPIGEDGRLPTLFTEQPPTNASGATNPVPTPTPGAGAAPRTTAVAPAGPDEERGTLKFCAKGRRGWYAFIVPDFGAPDIHVSEPLCLQAGLTTAAPGAAVGFVRGDGNSAAQVRLV